MQKTQKMIVDSNNSIKTTINWDSSWQELDLTFGIATDRNGSLSLLNPADFGVTPVSGVQFTDVLLLASDSSDRIYAGSNNHIDARRGNDTLLSIDDYTGNQIIGGPGADTFYLQATNNLVIGGEVFANSELHGLPSDVALADSEADTYFIDSSSKPTSISQFLKIYDFEFGRDLLFVDGFKVEMSDWATVRDLLSSNNIDINATPESTLERIIISLNKGVATNIDLAPFVLDRDNDAVRALKLRGPDWITVSGTALTVNTPSEITEEELRAVDLEIGYTDEKAVAPFTASLTLNKAENHVHRLYNPSQGEHLLSSNPFEIDLLTGGDWKDEGVFHITPELATADIFRFYLTNEGRHFYTALESERDFIVNNKETFPGWQYEGAAFSAYSTIDHPDDAVAVVRYLNQQTGGHFYSTSTFEQSLLDQNSDWLNEGIAWFGDATAATEILV